MTAEDCRLREATRCSRWADFSKQPAGERPGRRSRATELGDPSQKFRSSSDRVEIKSALSSRSSPEANRFLFDTCKLKSRQTSVAKSLISSATATTTAASAKSMLMVSIIVVVLITATQFQLANSSMCQHHQAMLDLAAAASSLSAANPSGLSQPMSSQHLHNQQAVNLNSNAPTTNKTPFETQSLIVCPKSSQYNNLPQFPTQHVNPNLVRQQHEIMKHLNASFASHLQLGGAGEQGAALASANFSPDQSTSSLPSELIDDELLNEIISPIVVDAAYERAKELIVKRRKLENELVRQGFITDMSKPTAVARHQRVTTTTSRGNELEKSQEVFEEMSRILAKKASSTKSVPNTISLSKTRIPCAVAITVVFCLQIAICVMYILVINGSLLFRICGGMYLLISIMTVTYFLLMARRVLSYLYMPSSKKSESLYRLTRLIIATAVILLVFIAGMIMVAIPPIYDTPVGVWFTRLLIGISMMSTSVVHTMMFRPGSTFQSSEESSVGANSKNSAPALNSESMEILE